LKRNEKRKKRPKKHNRVGVSVAGGMETMKDPIQHRMVMMIL
jgi:hypothetical protein